MRCALALCGVMFCGMGPAASGFAVLRAEEKPREEPDWVVPMTAVHTRFKGQRGTFAHFGDSISVTMAFWAPLRDPPKDSSCESSRAYRRVKDYMAADCWAKWKGPEFGSDGEMTIRWAHQNIDTWLTRLDPEVALIMFGTNDLRQVELEEYRQKTRDVVRRCLKNGTIVILNTIPPRSGLLDESRKYAEAAAAIAREEHVPLVDYFAEILRRRPDDWDGTLKKFADVPGNEYQVTTLISRDGVHPSNPGAHFGSFSQDSLNNSGYGLRNHLALLAYSRVIDRTLDPKTKPQGRPPSP